MSEEINRFLTEKLSALQIEFKNQLSSEAVARPCMGITWGFQEEGGIPVFYWNQGVIHSFHPDLKKQIEEVFQELRNME